METVEARVARIDERTAGLSKLVEMMHAENRKRLDSQDTKLSAIEETTNSLAKAAAFGQNIWWTLTRLGTLVLLAVGAIAWLIDHIPHWVSGK